MLDILQIINTYVWNILGVFIGIPLLTAIAFSAIITIIGLITIPFTFRKHNGQ